MDPRISFSNDFAEPHQVRQCHGSYREAPVSSDFEFRVSNYGMIPADQIFSKGMLLPLKDNSSNQGRKMTLREELLANDDEFEGSLPRLKRSGWWKERLALKRAQVVPKRNHASILGRAVEEEKMAPMAQQEFFFKQS